MVWLYQKGYITIQQNMLHTMMTTVGPEDRYQTQDNPGGADYLGFGFQSLKAVNPTSVPI
jgi:hypothetical protein